MKWLFRLVVLAALAAAGYFGWQRYGHGQAVVAQPAKRGSAAEIVYGTGTVEPVTWAKVFAPVRARITSHCRCEGRMVKPGDVLAKLDEKAPRAELTQLEARKSFLNAEIGRQTDLVQRGVTSRQAYERAQSDLLQVEAQIAAANARLTDYTLTAPIGGQVLRADGQVGEIAGITEPMFWVGSQKPLNIVADVNEEDIARVEERQTVLLRTDAFPTLQLRGSVASITPKGDPAKKTFRIYIALPDDTPLRIGMSVEANIIIAEKSNVLVVPAEALAGNAVFVTDGERVARRSVTTGIRGTRFIEISDGLAEGERIIAPVPKELKDGVRVRVIEKAAP
jgi:RND family efflux transporter MFP subunit